MITEELVTCLARFFDRKGPSHDELSSDFRRVGLQAGEAVSQFPGEQVGKMRRVRAVLTHALDHNVAAGDRLIPILIARLRATGSFRPAGQEYAGTELIEAAREAFRHAG